MSEQTDPLPISTQDDLVRTSQETVQTVAETVQTQQDVQTLEDTVYTPDDTPPSGAEERALVPPDAIPQ